MVDVKIEKQVRLVINHDSIPLCSRLLEEVPEAKKVYELVDVSMPTAVAMYDALSDSYSNDKSGQKQLEFHARR